MKLEFDPRDPNECSMVLAAIFGIHGETIMGSVEQFVTHEGAAIELPAADVAAIVAQQQGEDLPDAGTAFGGAPSAEAAFAAPGNEPAPAAIVPAVPAAPIPNAPAAPSSAVELDADGLPWDARIHSGPADKRPKTADGKWRQKRGVEKSSQLYIDVVGELRQVMGAPAAPLAAPPVPPVPAAAPAPMPAPPAPPPTPAAVAMEHGAVAATPAVEVPAAPPAPPVPAVPAAAPAPAPAPAAPAAAITDFAGLMKQITALQTAGKLTVADTTEIATSLGLTAVRDLVKRPDLVPSFAALLPGLA